MSEQNSLCFPCLEKVRTKFPVFPVPWPPCIGQSQVRRDPSSPSPHHTGTPPPRHVQTCSLGPHHTGTPSRPRHVQTYVARTVGKRVVGIQLKCLLVIIYFLLLLVNYTNALIRTISNINLIVQSCV